MKVYVVSDLVYEENLAVFSSEESAQAFVERVTQARPHHSGEIAYDEFELDEEPEMLA